MVDSVASSAASAGRKAKAHIAGHIPHVDRGRVTAAADASKAKLGAAGGVAVAVGRRASAAIASVGKEVARSTVAAGHRLSTALAAQVDTSKASAAAASGKAKASGVTVACCRASAVLATAAKETARHDTKRLPLVIMCGCFVVNIIAVATPIVTMEASGVLAANGSVYMFRGGVPSGNGFACAMLTLAALLLLGATIAHCIVKWMARYIALQLMVAR